MSITFDSLPEERARQPGFPNMNWPTRLLIALMGSMAILQLVSYGDFVDILRTYDAVPSALHQPLAVALIAAEAITAATLLKADTRRTGALIGLTTAIVWSILGTQAFVRDLDLSNCGCFGRFFSQPLRWWVLLQDVYFVALPLLVLRRLRTGRSPTPTDTARTPV